MDNISNKKKFSGRRYCYSTIIDKEGARRDIITARINKGLSQEKMAEKLNISRPAYALIESGKRTGKDYLDEIYHILDMEV